MMKCAAYEIIRKSTVILTAEKLSGCGVLCSKSAVYLSQILQEKMDCIFVAEDSKFKNNHLTI